ncbi:radical SAM domain iron-sulfur cluster-binding oxidoreductase [Geotalea daltonii FRC-32]|uniref:Radical SAM domain iron-sulfur cluster-binding oxidoreductase n=1 Tax=Geotalea daltonii (strain DSM 22248 / JCM 15807 / FRC-32) TaxID=316067 RepID=B9LZY5_GEODF|nr:radical SAM protein [Geotalea daltonii]ACM20765.1 radical SAM domain iron-sulfur cluster-binding oxidoreductase [Geotalea daltonii FRC-32]
MKTTDLSQIPVDIMVTYRCNLNCNKCYAPKEGSEASLAEIKHVLDKLYIAGLRRVVLTGGEPTVREDVADIAQYAKKIGFAVYLSTNGLLLKQIWKEISPYLSWISISLDAPSAELDKIITGELGAQHFTQVVEFLRYYKEYDDLTAKVKLGTVVTKKNIDHVALLGKIMFEKFPLYTPDVWRFYQFSNFNDYNDNYSYIDSLSIPQDDFEGLMQNLKEYFPDVHISHATAAERDESYVFVKPDLTLAYSSKGDYVSLGDTKQMTADHIREAFHEINHLWDKCVSNRAIYS